MIDGLHIYLRAARQNELALFAEITPTRIAVFRSQEYVVGIATADHYGPPASHMPTTGNGNRKCLERRSLGLQDHTAES